MKYTSTRNSAVSVTSAEAIAEGLSPDGGLYVPAELPRLSKEFILSLGDVPYHKRAYEVLKLFLTDLDGARLESACEKAYSEKFNASDVAPIKRLKRGTYLLELWHGPTCAFKDRALQILP